MKSKTTQATYISISAFQNMPEENYYSVFKSEMSIQGFEVNRTEVKPNREYPDGFYEISIKKSDTAFFHRGVVLNRISILDLIARYNDYQRATYISERDILRFVEIINRPEISSALKSIFDEKT